MNSLFLIGGTACVTVAPVLPHTAEFSLTALLVVWKHSQHLIQLLPRQKLKKTLMLTKLNAKKVS